MKRFIAILMLLLVSTFSFSQRAVSLQELYDAFEVGATISTVDKVLIIQDNIKIDSTDILFRISYLFKTTETYFKIADIEYRDIISTYDAIAYRTEQFTFMVKSDWVVQYYMSDSMKKSEMLNATFNEQYAAFIKAQKTNGNIKQYK